MLAPARDLRALLTISLVALAGGVAGAQQVYQDDGLRGWREANSPAAAHWQSQSWGSPRPGRTYQVSQPNEEVLDGQQTPEEGELVATPEPEFPEDDGFIESSDGCLGEDCAAMDECLDEDPTPWYAQGDATFLSRSRPPKLIFSRVRQIVVFQSGPIGFDRPVLSTKQVKFDFEPGTRVTLGRNLYRDILNRQHSVEFTFLGLYDWGTNASIQGTRISSGLVNFGSLLSDVDAGGIDVGGTIIGGFNGADIHRVRSLSDLNNYELNYRLRRLPGRDRIVAGPGGTWTRQCTPGLSGSLLTGIRYVSINEQMSFSSQGTAVDTFANQSFDFSAAYRVVTHNDLVGWQLGGDLIAQECRWSLGASCKAGLFANVSNQTSDVAVNNNVFAASPDSFFKASDVNAAFVGDLGLLATWRLTPSITLRTTYDFMWVQGIALGPQQIQHKLSNPPRVNNGSYTVFQGVSFGGEYRW